MTLVAEAQTTDLASALGSAHGPIASILPCSLASYIELWGCLTGPEETVSSVSLFGSTNPPSPALPPAGGRQRRINLKAPSGPLAVLPLALSIPTHRLTQGLLQTYSYRSPLPFFHFKCQRKTPVLSQMPDLPLTS